MTDGRKRRDPRAEREARRSRAEAPPPQNEAPAPAGRVRRDPRAERRARQSGQAAVPDRPEAAPAPSAVRVIEDPACMIVAVPDLAGGQLSGADRDLLGAARALADTLGGAVLVPAFEAPKDDLGAAGADRVVRVEAGRAPEARTAALAALAGKHAARHLIFPERPAAGGDLGRRVAARLGERAATGVWRIADGRVSRRAGGGSRDVTLAATRVLILAAETGEPLEGTRHEARALEPAAVEAGTRLEDRGLVPMDPDAVPLAEAEFIVAAGHGVTDWDGFAEVAAALGAKKGGSRVVVDAGLLPRDRQIGVSGTLVTARCYLALGISGAPQHLQGIAQCERVVAVNRDPGCDMMARADLAVVGDAQAVMPALAKLARERRGG